MSVDALPAVNATLNATSAVLLGTGLAFIRRGDRERHRACMIAAFTVSVVFLASYVTYHSQHGSTPYPAHDWTRPVYFAVLVSHVILAMAVPVLAVITLIRGLRDDVARHRRIAKITFPIWMYVSVTGVIVYLMLYPLAGATP